MRAPFSAFWLLLLVLLLSASAFAQSESDALAREAFQEGRKAFNEARYEDALHAFQKSYELSGRGELYYNMGLAADRLRMNDEALHAFESYLEEVEKPTREVEVRERIGALQRAIDERAKLEAARVEQFESMRVAQDRDAQLEQARMPKKRKRAIVGSAVLGVVGLAGLGAMTAGLVKNGACKARDASGNCVETESVNRAAVAVYGSIGAAAVAGAAVWFGLGGRKKTEVAVGAGTVHVRGKF